MLTNILISNCHYMVYKYTHVCQYSFTYESAFVLKGLLKTMLRGCCPVCSKGCLLMSEPTWERGKRDKVRAVSHASWQGQGIGVGGEGCAGVGESSHSDSWVGMGQTWWNKDDLKERCDVKLRRNLNALALCLTYTCKLTKTAMGEGKKRRRDRLYYPL